MESKIKEVFSFEEILQILVREAMSRRGIIEITCTSSMELNTSEHTATVFLEPKKNQPEIPEESP